MLSRSRLLALACVLPLAACSSDEGDSTTDTGTTDTGGAETGGDTTGSDAGADAAACDPVVSHQDQIFRMVAISISKPAGRGAFLEGLMQADFDADKLHILIENRNFGAPCGDTTYEITGNAGQRVSDGVYTWFDGIELEYKTGTMSASGAFTNSESLSLIFPVVEPASDPPEIIPVPVVDINLNGVVGESGGQVVLEGTLTGAILLADAENITIEVVPGNPTTVADLLGVADLDYPAGAAEFTGWQLEAAIQAVVVDFAEPAEGSN
jgi:hypothetical protein